LIERYRSLFGSIRSRKGGEEVPSDQLRKALVVAKMLDIVDARRAELQAA
jgi:hypothetical protein